MGQRGTSGIEAKRGAGGKKRGSRKGSKKRKREAKLLLVFYLLIYK